VDPVVTNITNGVVTNITPANVVAGLSCSQPGNVLREFVGVRIVGCDELHAGIHQGGDEGQIAGQAVEYNPRTSFAVSSRVLVHLIYIIRQSRGETAARAPPRTAWRGVTYQSARRSSLDHARADRPRACRTAATTEGRTMPERIS
jgi:hypothetical protein